MKKHLLIVEDDAHIRLGLCDALRGEGYEVTDCRDGAQARIGWRLRARGASVRCSVPR